jgi:hypothetical protein
MINDQQDTTIGATALSTPSDREIVSERVFALPEIACSRPTPTPSSFPSGGVPGARQRSSRRWTSGLVGRGGSSPVIRTATRFVSVESIERSRPPSALSRRSNGKRDAGPRHRGDGDIRGSRRAHEGDGHLVLPHPRGARRHARLGHGERADRVPRPPRRAAREGWVGLIGEHCAVPASEPNQTPDAMCVSVLRARVRSVRALVKPASHHQHHGEHKQHAHEKPARQARVGRDVGD